MIEPKPPHEPQFVYDDVSEEHREFLQKLERGINEDPEAYKDGSHIIRKVGYTALGSISREDMQALGTFLISNPKTGIDVISGLVQLIGTRADRDLIFDEDTEKIAEEDGTFKGLLERRQTAKGRGAEIVENANAAPRLRRFELFSRLVSVRKSSKRSKKSSTTDKSSNAA